MKNYLIISLIILFSGCELFETREAEKPDSPNSGYRQPTSTDILIENLILSLKDKGLQDYLNIFSDSSNTGKNYYFYPSSGSASLYPVFQNEWTKSQEQQFFANLLVRIEQGQNISLSFVNEEKIPMGDSSQYKAKYFLNVPHNVTGFPKLFEGEILVKMVVDKRLLWSIYYWQDNKTSELPTWSELKGQFY